MDDGKGLQGRKHNQVCIQESLPGSKKLEAMGEVRQ